MYKNDKISEHERAQEILLTGLRLYNGINIQVLLKKLKLNSENEIIDIVELKKFKKLGLIDINKSIIKITKQGFPVLNHITSKLLK